MDAYRTEQFEADGYMTISNTGGIEIQLNNSGDGCRYRFNPDPENEVFDAEIIYQPDPDSDENEPELVPGFLHGEIFYKLGDFMRLERRKP